MAEILEGTSDTNAYAPLTQAQTVAVCRFLQQEIRNVQAELTETVHELQHTKESVELLKGSSNSNEDQVRNCVHEIAEAKVDIHTLQEELGRNTKATHALMHSEQLSKDRIAAVEEGEKMIQTRLDAIANEIAQQKEQAQKVKDDVANRIDLELKRLDKYSEGIKLALDQTNKEQEHLSKLQKETQSSVREAHVGIENVTVEIKKINTVAGILENRLGSTAKGVQQTWNKLAELSDGAIKINECYERTRTRSLENEAKVQMLADAQSKLEVHHEDSVRQVERNTDRLAQMLKLLDESGQGSEDIRHQLNSLKQNSEKVWKKVTELSRDLQEVNQATQQLRAGIKEQAQLLLPNIHMDSPEAAANSRVHGSLLIDDRKSNNKNYGGRVGNGVF